MTQTSYHVKHKLILRNSTSMRTKESSFLWMLIYFFEEANKERSSFSSKIARYHMTEATRLFLLACWSEMATTSRASFEVNKPKSIELLNTSWTLFGLLVLLYELALQLSKHRCSAEATPTRFRIRSAYTLKSKFCRHANWIRSSWAWYYHIK